MNQTLQNQKNVFLNQIITQLYLNGKKELEYLFPEIGIAEYMVLHIIAHIDDTKEDKTGKVYLKELSAAMDMTVTEASHLARMMAEKDLVEWTHDPVNASAGTYLMISSAGKELLVSQSAYLKENFDYINQYIGTERLQEMLRTILEIRTLLTAKKEMAYVEHDA